MQHITVTHFGPRPVTAAALSARLNAGRPPALPDGTAASIDKWALFNDLRDARAAFGVTDRDLGVLYALLTFLPGKLLGDGSLVVFPSNATLSDRAHGMAESTLRRHLAALVEAGLICRQDSPNGKRYAARGADGGVAVAFGLDLAPLRARAAEIAARAEDTRTAAAALHRAREALVLALRDATKLLAYARETVAGDWDGVEADLLPLRRALRRRMDAATVAACDATARGILAALTAHLSTEAEETIVTAARIERHHSNSKPDSSEFEPSHEHGEAAGSAPGLPLALVIKACPDLALFAGGTTARTWHELSTQAAQARPMLGISPNAWAEAQRIMGPAKAAIVLAAILQRAGQIANPGGYLRALTLKAANEGFSPGPMIMALLNAPDRRAA
jgi:replication initiation protein RepC